MSGMFLAGERCWSPDPSSKATLWVKAQHERALPPPCIVRKDPRVPHTARQGACHPVNNSRGGIHEFAGPACLLHPWSSQYGNQECAGGSGLHRLSPFSQHITGGQPGLEGSKVPTEGGSGRPARHSLVLTWNPRSCPPGTTFFCGHDSWTIKKDEC